MSYTGEVLADTPRLYLRLGEPSGTTATDSSGLGHDGSYVGCTLAQTGALTSDPDTAVLLDGIDDRVTVADHADLDLADTFTLECWLKRSTLSTQQHLFNKGVGAYNIQFKAGGTDLFSLACEGVAYIVDSTVAIADTTTFHHVVATKSGATSNLYLDGVDVTGAVTNSTCGDTTDLLYIGSQFGAGNFWLAGTLDEVALYATALSPARVLAHFQAAPSLPEQTAIWPYNRQGPF